MKNLSQSSESTTESLFEKVIFGSKILNSTPTVDGFLGKLVAVTRPEIEFSPENIAEYRDYVGSANAETLIDDDGAEHLAGSLVCITLALTPCMLAEYLPLALLYPARLFPGYRGISR